jgi:hypothetical protein
VNGHYATDNGELHKKRKREGKGPGVEVALSHWFSVLTGRDIRVSGPMLKSKPEKIGKKLGQNDFKATYGWLSRCDDAVSAEQWKSTNMPHLLQKFCADGI